VPSFDGDSGLWLNGWRAVPSRLQGVELFGVDALLGEVRWGAPDACAACNPTSRIIGEKLRRIATVPDLQYAQLPCQLHYEPVGHMVTLLALMRRWHEEAVPKPGAQSYQWRCGMPAAYCDREMPGDSMPG